MRHNWLHAISIMFALCDTAAAQSIALVEHSDGDDPCRHFKMRVLVPADLAAENPRVKKPADDIDPKMVWNPCLRDEPQLVLVVPIPLPNEKGGVFSPPSFKLQSPFEVYYGRKPPEPFLSEPSPAFKLIRRRQQ